MTPVAHRTGSDSAASAALKASHAVREIARARVLDSVVVRLAFGLTISDPTPGIPKLFLPKGSREPSNAKARSRAGSQAHLFRMSKGVRSGFVVTLDAFPEETFVDTPPG